MVRETRRWLSQLFFVQICFHDFRNVMNLNSWKMIFLFSHFKCIFSQILYSKWVQRQEKKARNWFLFRLRRISWSNEFWIFQNFFLIIQLSIFLFGIYKIKLTLNINDDQAKITSIRNNPLQNNRTYVNTHNWIFISRNINVLSNEIPV